MDDRKDKNENEENESDFWSDALMTSCGESVEEWLGEMFDMSVRDDRRRSPWR